MDNKQRKKLARAQSRQIIVGMLKNFSIKNCWHFMKEHWKEFLVAGGATLGAATFAGCVPKNNPPAIVQPSGDIESGDINSGDINSGEEKPDIPSGDIGSGDIGSGEEKPEPPSGETPDSGEENPGEETKYPSTIAEMTDEQKKILTDYLDETYKQRIIGKMSIGANLENTQTIGYEFDETSMTGLYKTANENGDNFYSIKCTASNDIDRLIKALVENKDISNFISVSVVGIKSSAIFTIPLTENEYSANAEKAYSTLNSMLETSQKTNSDTLFYTYKRQPIPEFETGNWPVVETIAITVDGNNYSLHMIKAVSKDYNKIGHEAVDTKILDEKYLEFGSENTIFVVSENQPIKE